MRIAWARERAAHQAARGKASKSWTWCVDPDVGQGRFRGSFKEVVAWATEHFLAAPEQQPAVTLLKRHAHKAEQDMPQALADWAFGKADSASADMVEAWGSQVAKLSAACQRGADSGAVTSYAAAELKTLLQSIHQAKVCCDTAYCSDGTCTLCEA